LIAKRLTDISGSSAYVIGGVVAYADEVKKNVLGVLTQTLIDHGAVSEPVAQQWPTARAACSGRTWRSA